MKVGKLIFVSGLTGAGKTTLVGRALNAISNLEVLLTYTTRPRREGEEKSYEYIFVDDEEYEHVKAFSNKWDETIYNTYKYASDAEKFINDLNSGINVIVSVTPNLEDISTMAQIYKTEPITIWINTDRNTAASRISDDKIRSQRLEDEKIKNEFDILFEPANDLKEDTLRFIRLIEDVLSKD